MTITIIGLGLIGGSLGLSFRQHGLAQHLIGVEQSPANAARALESRRVSRASLHMSGMAADVRLPGRDSFGLARLAAEMQIGGVGLYRRDGFVHLDCGPIRRW